MALWETKVNKPKSGGTDKLAKLITMDCGLLKNIKWNFDPYMHYVTAYKTQLNNNQSVLAKHTFRIVFSLGCQLYQASIVWGFSYPGDKSPNLMRDWGKKPWIWKTRGEKPPNPKKETERGKPGAVMRWVKTFELKKRLKRKTRGWIRWLEEESLSLERNKGRKLVI